MDSDLSRQLAERQRLRDREYQQANKQYLEARQADLSQQIDALEEGIATLKDRLTRIEEVLNLREIYALPSRE